MRHWPILAFVFIASPCLAEDGIPFRAVPSLQHSENACLSIYYNGDAAYWFNQCPYDIAVRWDDENKCQNWSCTAEIAANTKSAATIARHARWCECRGTLSSCQLPRTGC